VSVVVERLFPEPASLTVTEALDAFDPAAAAGSERPYLYVNMVATVDGRAAIGGRAQALGDEADLSMLLGLRERADAVLIGTGTLRAEGYARLVGAPERRERRVARGQGEDAVAVLISKGLTLPWDAGLFAAPEQPVLVYTEARGSAPLVPAPIEIVRLEDASPDAVLRELRARGVRGLLCEGGPTLNRSLLAAGLVDELFLTLAPLLTADDAEPRIVTGEALPDPALLELRWALRHGHELLVRYGVR
jgi:riboflavin biosynthesis pyrimidine reductase